MNRLLAPLVRPADRPFDRDIRALTSLRFFAAFMVVLYHFYEDLPIPINQYTPIFLKGRLAVDFFFVLSGFIIAHVYLGAVERGTFSAWNFITRRFARLYPLHIATLAASVMLMYGYRAVGHVPWNLHHYDVGAIPAQLLMVHAWGFMSGHTFNYPSWSISAEWFAYLLFVPLAYALVRARLRPGTLVLLALFALVAFAFAAPRVFAEPLTELMWNFGIARIVPEFLLGLAVYRWGREFTLTERAIPFAVFGSVFGVVAVAHYGLPDILAVGLFALLIVSVASQARNGTKSFLDRPALVYLGEISYSTYMVHTLCYTAYFGVAKRVLEPALYAAWVWPIWFGSLAFVLLASAASYHAVEVPGRRILGDALASRRMARAPSGSRG